MEALKSKVRRLNYRKKIKKQNDKYCSIEGKENNIIL